MIQPSSITEVADDQRDVLRTSRSPWRLIGCLVLVSLCAAISLAVHWINPANDHSVNNAVSMVLAAIAFVGAAWLVVRLTSGGRSRWIRLALVLAVLAFPFAVFRIRGFTGEILPVLEFRFSPYAKTKPTDTLVERELGEGTARLVAQRPFPEFLGPQRRAVISERLFEIPLGVGEGPVEAAELWRKPIGDGWGGFAIQEDLCVTLEQRDTRECVTCYRLSDGGLVWISEETARHEHPLGGIGPRSTPTIADARVYTQGATGIVTCLDLQTGKSIWRVDLIELAGWDQDESETAISWGRASSPLLVDDLCILPLGSSRSRPPADPALAGRSLIALDISDGSVRWTAGEDQISYASPMLFSFSPLGESEVSRIQDDSESRRVAAEPIVQRPAASRQIVSVNEATVTGHDVATGQVAWSIRWDGQSNGGANCASAVPVGDHAFLVGKGYGRGGGLFELVQESDSFRVTPRWTSRTVLKTKFTHTCVDGDHGYALSDGTLQCVDLITGKTRWQQPRGRRYGHGQMILVEDVLVVQAESGKLAIVSANPDQFEELAAWTALPGKTWNVPAVAGRFLAVRNDQEAAVYRLPAREQTQDILAGRHP